MSIIFIDGELSEKLSIVMESAKRISMPIVFTGYEGNFNADIKPLAQFPNVLLHAGVF